MIVQQFYSFSLTFLLLDPDDNKSKSVFNVGEITRLMKFPGVTPTFVVKIVAGLPSGESHLQ